MPYIGFYMVCLAMPPLIVLFLIYFLKKDYHNWRKYIWLYALVIGLFAYSYVPLSGDLSRYLLRLDRYTSFTLKQAINSFYWLDSCEVAWNWMVAKSGIPGLLSGIPQFVIYFIAAYITCDYLERNDAEEKIFKALIIQFLVLPEISTINNVFCVSAFAVFSLAVYKDLIQRKRNITTLFLYIFPCFIHSSAIVLVILRVLAIIIKKGKYVAFVFVFILPFLLNILHQNASMFRSSQVIYRLIESGYQYYSGAEGNKAYTISRLYFISFVHNMLFSVISLFTILNTDKIGRRTSIIKTKAENTFSSFLLLVSVLAIGCVIFSAPHYWRFNFVVKLCVAVLLYFTNYDWKTRKICIYLFVLDGILVKFVETVDFIRIANVGETFSNFLFSSPFGILAKLFIELFK